MCVPVHGDGNSRTTTTTKPVTLITSDQETAAEGEKIGLRESRVAGNAARITSFSCILSSLVIVINQWKSLITGSQPISVEISLSSLVLGEQNFPHLTATLL